MDILTEKEKISGIINYEKLKKMNPRNFSDNYLDTKNLHQDSRLLSIINDSIKTVNEKYHQDISISIIDLSQSYTCCNYAGYQDTVQRYPASIVKLFWVVMLNSMHEAESLNVRKIISFEDELKAIHESDNEAASKILDFITMTNSSFDYFLDEEQFRQWFSNRKRVNEFFLMSGYGDLNLTQKTFPLPNLGVYDPKGSDLQIREYNLDGTLSSNPPVRNYLTTFQVAKLLYDISSENLLSAQSSSHIKSLLYHDQSSEAWRNTAYRGIEGFLGEYLPGTVKIYTKIGYTKSYGRQEGAIIESDDGKTRYILVVFANNSFFSEEKSKIFPEISRFIYERMSSGK
jgi:hypothetical protein